MSATPVPEAAEALPRALDTFCRQEAPRVLGLLSLYCGDRDLAEELTQEALARACVHWSRLATADDPQQWLTRVALNLAKSSFRSRSARRRVIERYGPSIGRATTGTDAATALAVRAAVAQLPERRRRALVLRYFADLPVAAVAALMHCPEGTVKTLTSEAIAQLRRAGLEVTDA